MASEAAPNPQHKDLVREEFTRQANDYAAAPMIRDADHIEKLVTIVAPRPDARVLEIATGPGHVAMAFAKVAREVVGVDLTEAPLKIAEKMRAERGLKNLSFRHGDVEARLPFGDGEFDVVVCRFAVHHFENPAKVIGEMARLCRVDGTVAIEDLISSEHPAGAERTPQDDGGGGAGNHALRIIGDEESGRSMVSIGANHARARGRSARDDRARPHRGSERRTSRPRRRRAFLYPSPRDCDGKEVEAPTPVMM